MLRILLVDDEPFILQGLQVLIDWRKEGFEIAATAANGLEALDFLKENSVDLIIADINMPMITGVELLEKIRSENISNAYFIILSGHADFTYAQKAIRYNCTDYILKPIERDGLIDVLRKVTAMNDIIEERTQTNWKLERAYLARNIIAAIQGKYDSANLEYVKNHLRVSSELRYIEIEIDNLKLNEKITDEEKRSGQRKLLNACLEFLKEDESHCVFDVSGMEKIYDVGFVYCDYMAKNRKISEDTYLTNFVEYLQDIIKLPVTMLVGKKVNDIGNIAKSYATACMLRSFQGFRSKKNIYYYEKEAQVTKGGILLCKKSIDSLLHDIEENDHVNIIKSVDRFYEEMRQMGVTGETMNLNINYLLFQLIHLAFVQDNTVNQEEIFRVISESAFEDGIIRGSKAHLSKFACKYGDYLNQLRCNVSRGVLGSIEKEIQENFADNLTLKGLSEKYYVNSAYLGQLFRKKYGHSFKDYLNNYRMEQAVTMLLRTDRKIYQIAEAVGYHDQDYFVNRFITAKGCTPAKFRKQL